VGDSICIGEFVGGFEMNIILAYQHEKANDSNENNDQFNGLLKPVNNQATSR